MNNVLMRKIDVTANYEPLTTDQTVVTATISCPPGNVANVLFKCGDGTDIPWIPGEWHTLHSVNLADIEIKGTVGDTITVVGGSW